MASNDESLGGYALKALLGAEPVEVIEKKPSLVAKIIGAPFKLLAALIKAPFLLVKKIITAPFKLLSSNKNTDQPT